MVEKVSSGVGATPNNPSSQSAAQRVQTIAGASAEDVATFFSEEEWIELLSSYPDFYDLVAEALGADDPIGLVGADLMTPRSGSHYAPPASEHAVG